jgi:hypothetical protein
MGELIHKSHNFVFVAKYRRLVINKEIDKLPKEIDSVKNVSHF